jgi:hypothetical protein
MVRLSPRSNTGHNKSPADWFLGLHLTPDGYRVLYHQLMALISDTWPDQLPEKLPMVLPAWNELEAWKDL